MNQDLIHLSEKETNCLITNYFNDHIHMLKNVSESFELSKDFCCLLRIALRACLREIHVTYWILNGEVIKKIIKKIRICMEFIML